MPQISAPVTANTKLRVANYLRKDATTTRDRYLKLWGAIIEHEISAGTHFIYSLEGHLYTYLGLTGEVIMISKQGSDRFGAYLNEVYGLVTSEPVATWIYNAFRNYGIQHASKVELRRFAAYDVTTHTAYMSGYNGQTWRIDGGEPTQIANGEDEIFFIDDDGGVPVTPDIGPHGILFDKLIDGANFVEAGLTLGGIRPDQQKKALFIWMLMLAFPDLMPTKPLLLVEGAPGSGKSSLVQFLQLALMGAKKPLIINESNEADFGVLLLRSPIAVLDNLDSFIKWIPDAVCAYTTAGFWTRRKLFSDNEEVIIKPHAFIAVASKNPASFRREDVVDRTVVLRLERRKGFKRANQLEKDILDNRAQLLGEYMYYVNEIVAHLRTSAGDAEVEETTRMADFAFLGRAVAAVMNWPAGEIDDLLKALEAERYAFSNEDDSLIELLNHWIAYRPKNGPSNIGRPVSADELFAELEGIAQARNTSFYNNKKLLIQKIRSPHLDKDFIVQQMAIDGHKMFRFWRKGVDPVLNVVMDDHFDEVAYNDDD